MRKLHDGKENSSAARRCEVVSVRLREDKYRRVELGGSSPWHFYSSGDSSVLNDLFKDVWIAKQPWKTEVMSLSGAEGRFIA